MTEFSESPTPLTFDTVRQRYEGDQMQWAEDFYTGIRNSAAEITEFDKDAKTEVIMAQEILHEIFTLLNSTMINRGSEMAALVRLITTGKIIPQDEKQFLQKAGRDVEAEYLKLYQKSAKNKFLALSDILIIHENLLSIPMELLAAEISGQNPSQTLETIVNRTSGNHDEVTDGHFLALKMQDYAEDRGLRIVVPDPENPEKIIECTYNKKQENKISITPRNTSPLETTAIFQQKNAGSIVSSMVQPLYP